MGKGGGCVPSKKKPPTGVPAPPPRDAPVTPDDHNVENSAPAVESRTAAAEAGAAVAAESSGVVGDSSKNAQRKIFIVFYSMYGHVEGLARRMKNGVDGVEGVEGVLFRVPETLSSEVLEKMNAPVKDPGIPDITAAELADADGVLFGFPTRYGSMAAQMKAFFDSTGQLWKEQKLAGKPAGFFVSTGAQGGGQETTAWTAITQLAHHGMLFVPVGYTFGAGMFRMDVVHGGSPYGAGVYAGDGSRELNEIELALAEHQGKYMATIVKRLAP